MIKVNFDCRNNCSLIDVPNKDHLIIEEFSEYQRQINKISDEIKVYDRSNSVTKQIYYENNYICSCLPEEVPLFKNIVGININKKMDTNELKQKMKEFKKTYHGKV